MGLAQNEMKAKPTLPERVRSMEWLGRILDVLWRQRPRGIAFDMEFVATQAFAAGFKCLLQIEVHCKA